MNCIVVRSWCRAVNKSIKICQNYKNINLFLRCCQFYWSTSSPRLCFLHQFYGKWSFRVVICILVHFWLCVCCIFWPAFGCCAPKTLVKICIFNVFGGKKLKKKEKQARNLQQNLRKKSFFKFAPKCWSSVLFPD